MSNPNQGKYHNKIQCKYEIVFHTHFTFSFVSKTKLEVIKITLVLSGDTTDLRHLVFNYIRPIVPCSIS